MTNSSFWENNKAYIYTALGLAVVGFVFIKFMMIMDWGYLIGFTAHAVTGDISGVLSEPKSVMEQFVNAAFGPSYNAIAPEIIRASNERQEYIWYVFLAEIAIFAFLYAKNGRVEPKITRPNDMVTVFSPFQRAVIWLNIGMICILVFTGFNITWSLNSGGGTLPRYLRMFHELTGLAWIAVWLTFTVIAAKDSKAYRKEGMFNIFLPGKFKPSKRVIWFFFAAMGAGLCFSGAMIITLHPNAFTHAEFIQLKRALLYLHFGASVLIMFFILDYVYASAVSVKGYLRGLWSGKYPREYLEQVSPDILEDLKK
ncbi:MAG TPA: cytochrome b/b6 domain-containing protein [Campylobacterales bacterium]|nr:cytochrome b/b6 domain-containing protein [Campylobacterales bacterium]